MQNPSVQRLPISAPGIGLTTLAGTLGLNLLALALPLVVLQVFDRVIPYQASETLFFLFLGLCVVTVLEFVLKWCRAVLLSSKAEQFEVKLYEKFVSATLNADPEAFREVSPASHLDRLEAITQLRSHYGGQARILAIDLPFTMIFVALIGLIGGWLILVPLTCAALLLLFKFALANAQSSVFTNRKTLDSRRHTFLVEVLSQIGAVKANTMEPQMQRRYELLQQQSANISHSVILFSGLSQAFGGVFSQIAVVGMGLFGGYLVVSGYIGIAELAACMLLNGRTVQPMLKALSLWAQSESLNLAKSKVSEACTLPQRPAAPPIAQKINGHIRFEKLSLKHPTRDEYIFENIEEEIEPGQLLALSGHGGSGKTSFLKLLLAEITPTSGRVLIDGQTADHFSNMRGTNGLVFCGRNPTIFAGTVLENLAAFGDGDAIERGLNLSEKMGIQKILNRLPMGYNTPLHESPALLHNRSFLQGVTLVRAIALRPKILLLNDVTGVMDTSAKSKFSSVLSELKGQTTVVFSSMDEEITCLADKQLILETVKQRTRREWVEDCRDERAASQPDFVNNNREKTG